MLSKPIGEYFFVFNASLFSQKIEIVIIITLKRYNVLIGNEKSERRSKNGK